MTKTTKKSDSDCFEGERDGWTASFLKENIDEQIKSVREYFDERITKEVEVAREFSNAIKNQEERDIGNNKIAIENALLSQEKLVNAAFASSEKAIDKAQTAQEAYNARSNEFRQALDDSNKDKISRNEFVTTLSNLSDKIDEIDKKTSLFVPRAENDQRWARDEVDIKTLQLNTAKASDVVLLQLDQATLAGKADQKDVSRVILISYIGIFFGVVGTLIAIINLLTRLVTGK